MTRNREQRLDRCLMCVLDAFGAPDPLVVDEPPPLAAVEVGSEVHQRVDHLLAPLLELGHGDRRGDLMREDRKGPLLDRRISALAGDSEHAERPAAGLQGLCAGRADAGRQAVRHPAP